MNEWEFTGDVNSWINEILDHIPIPPFHRSKVEQTGAAGRKRRDLSILDKSKRVVLTGEVKLPYQADGNSPYVTKVVDDARKKAVADARAKAELYASAAGVSLGRVVQISESGGVIMPPQPMYRMAAMDGAASVPIAAGQQTLGTNVSITYEIQ